MISFRELNAVGLLSIILYVLVHVIRLVFSTAHTFEMVQTNASEIRELNDSHRRLVVEQNKMRDDIKEILRRVAPSR